MANEFEIVRYPKIKNLNIFIVEMEYRTLHIHRDFELNLILDGHMTIFSNSKRYSVSTGDLLLFNPNQPHELFAQGEICVKILCLQISPRFFRDTLPAMQDVSFQMVKLRNNEIGNWIKSFSRNFVKLALTYIEEPHPYYQLLCASRINEIFYLLLEHIPVRFPSPMDRKAIERKAERILRLLDFVDSNFMYKINLGDFAQAEGLSLNHLSYFIKENINQTFQEYVTNIRYNHACKLLLSGDKRLIDICFESGFSDPRYLTKAFLKKTGMRPDEYRHKFAAVKPEEQYQRNRYSSQKFYSDAKAKQILSNYCIEEAKTINFRKKLEIVN